MPTRIPPPPDAPTSPAPRNRRATCGPAPFLAVAAFAVTGAALAQGTLGELLDAGGRKLVGDAFRTEIVGAALSGPSRTGGSVEFAYRSDGTFSGTVRSPHGRGSGVLGSWKIDDEGRVCVEFAIVATERKDSNCGYLFKLGDTLYASESDSDRAAIVLQRTARR